MRPSLPASRALVMMGALCLAQFLFAFAAAPHACEWGLTAYVQVGVATQLLLAAAPWVLRAGRGSGQRFLILVAGLSAGAASWLAGLFMANIRIICRLF